MCWWRRLAQINESLLSFFTRLQPPGELSLTFSSWNWDYSSLSINYLNRVVKSDISAAYLDAKFFAILSSTLFRNIFVRIWFNCFWAPRKFLAKVSVISSISSFSSASISSSNAGRLSTFSLYFSNVTKFLFSVLLKRLWLDLNHAKVYYLKSTL